MSGPAELAARVGNALVCPLCLGELEFDSDFAGCGRCGTRFPQGPGPYLDLLPPGASGSGEAAQVERRQREMEAWYEDLLADPPRAAELLSHDYRPFAEFLSSLSGSILDVGGGLGVPREYLSDTRGYVVVDPSLLWLKERWSSLAEHLPSLASPPAFVRGVGEHLPFRTRSQDAVLAFWTLNHVSHPDRVLAEIGRVLRPGGRCLLALEDMIPTRRDILRRALETARSEGLREGLRHAALVLGHREREWPLQSDHIRISERSIEQWSEPLLRATRREWLGEFLVIESIRTDALPFGAALGRSQ